MSLKKHTTLTQEIAKVEQSHAELLITQKMMID